MKKTRTILLLLMLTFGIVAHAQEKNLKNIHLYSINLSAGPGTMKLKNDNLEEGEDKIEEEYRLMSYNIGLEYMPPSKLPFYAICYSVDLGYAKATSKEFSFLKRDVISGDVFAVIVFGGGFRLQIPIEIGLGYVSCSAIKVSSTSSDDYDYKMISNYFEHSSLKYSKFEILMRARVKYYITDKIGVYVGWTGGSPKTVYYGGLTIQL